MQYIENLEADWDDFGAKKVMLIVIAFAKKIIDELAAEVNMSYPGIFPLPTGGVTIEWVDKRQLLSVDISPDTPLFSVFYHELDGESEYFDYEDYRQVTAKVKEINQRAGGF